MIEAKVGGADELMNEINDGSVAMLPFKADSGLVEWRYMKNGGWTVNLCAGYSNIA